MSVVDWLPAVVVAVVSSARTVAADDRMKDADTMANANFLIIFIDLLRNSFPVAALPHCILR